MKDHEKDGEQKDQKELTDGKHTGFAPHLDSQGPHLGIPPRVPLIHTLLSHNGLVNSLVVTADGRRALSASQDMTVKVWDIESGEMVRTLKGHRKEVDGVAVAADGKCAVSASRDNTLRVWNIETGAATMTLRGHAGWVHGVAVTPDGKWAVSASADTTLKVWDLQNGKEIRTLKRHTAPVWRVVVTADGRRALSASYDNTVIVWDIETGEDKRTLKGHSDRVRGIAVSSDGNWAVSASADKTLKVWNMKTGRLERTLEVHTGPVLSVAITYDNRYILSGGEDKTVCVCDLDTGQQIASLEGHEGAVWGVAVSWDGRYAVSGSEDETVRIWDLQSAISQSPRSTEQRNNSGQVVEWRDDSTGVVTTQTPSIYPRITGDRVERDEEDRLDIRRDVYPFASVFSLRDISPPICLGLFGDWGSGKSFFMKQMEKRIDELAAASRTAEEKHEPTDYCSNIAQITFNAWHYIDANLWASLVTRIFEGLDEFIDKNNPDESEKLRRNLYGKLVTAEKRLEAARKNEQKAEEAIRAAEKSLAEVQQINRLKAILTLGARQLGLPDISELKNTLSEMDNLWSRIRRTARNLFNATGVDRVVIVLLLFVVLSACTYHLVSRVWPKSSLTAVLSSLIIFLTQVCSGFALAVRSTSRLVRKINEQMKEMEPEPKGIDLTARMDSLAAKGKAAKAEICAAQEDLIRARGEIQALENLDSGRVLTDFIKERVESVEYRKHLGIISAIRKDLEALTDILERAREKRESSMLLPAGEIIDGKPLPHIDRIILYIDDLDRCPENRVVEVLQAVHLLLAFNLFIVVVGVDPRWLLRSLERRYISVTRAGRRHELLRETNSTHWSTTAYDYLDKIFQIPFRLSPMSPGGLMNLVESTIRSESPPDAPSVTIPEWTATPSLDEEMEDPETASLPDKDDPRLDVTESDNTHPPAQEKMQTSSATGAGIDLTPNSVAVCQIELDFIKCLSEMIPNPRAAKRFVNIYRFIKATQDELDLPTFVGTQESPGRFRSVMILLGILTGFPSLAHRLFQEIMESADDRFLTDCCNTLGHIRNSPPANGLHFRQQTETIEQISAPEPNKYAELSKVVRNTLSTMCYTNMPIREFKPLIPVVSRFSVRGDTHKRRENSINTHPNRSDPEIL